MKETRFITGDIVELKKNFRSHTNKLYRKGSRGLVGEQDPYDKYSLAVCVGKGTLYIPKIAVDNYLRIVKEY